MNPSLPAQALSEATLARLEDAGVLSALDHLCAAMPSRPDNMLQSLLGLLGTQDDRELADRVATIIAVSFEPLLCQRAAALAAEAKGAAA